MITSTNRIYHYCSLKTAIEFILPNKQLLLNTMGKTNDPRENKSFAFAGRNIGNEFSKTLTELNSDVTQEIRKDCKLICFSSDSSNIFGYEYSRMWSLYGDNHSGVCVEFNENRFASENFSKVGSGHFNKIIYEDIDTRKAVKHKTVDFYEVEKLGLRKYVREVFRPKHIDYLFFTKNKEWESESEVRLIYFSDSSAAEYCSISTCINRIILGVDFNLNYYPAIADKLTGVQIDKLFYDGDARLFPGRIII
jgi:hypothetical protein